MVMAGLSDTFQTVVRRFNRDGGIDVGFGVAGVTFLPGGPLDHAAAVGVDGRGRIVVARSLPSPSSVLAPRVDVVTRLRPDGAIDWGYGTRGDATVGRGGYISALDVDRDDVYVIRNGPPDGPHTGWTTTVHHLDTKGRETWQSAPLAAPTYEDIWSSALSVSTNRVFVTGRVGDALSIWAFHR